MTKFPSFPIKLPSLPTQKRIVNILSTLDDKIEVNRRINDNLEQQAQALFKSWFVDFEPFKNGEFVESDLGRIPKGWRVEVLGDVCKCILGGTPSRNKEEYWNGNIAWINSGEVNEFRIVKPSEYITEEGLKHSATKLLPKKTTVLAITGATIGQVSLLEIDSCANQSVIGVLENDNIPYEFIYPLINVKITELCSHMTGGAQQHINKNNVEQLNIVLPSENVMAEYKEKTKSIYSQITNCCFESRRLAELRDTLLPKLMSGELKVNEIEK
jgi:type I restriction enzyme S subunit